MTASGIFLSFETLSSAPPSLVKQILALVSGELTIASDLATVTVSGEAGDMSEDEHFAELSPGQVKTFLAGCGPKTKLALETMANSKTRTFQLAAIAKALGVNAGELSGVWSGLTRRVKTVTGDSEAYLIYWLGEPVYDDNDEDYVDQTGELTELTYQSLRKAFGLK